MSNNSINHLALIMDGNKRWSKKNSVSQKDAYIAGLNNLIKISNFCLEENIKYLTVYAMSAENFYRADIKTIFDIIIDKAQQINKDPIFTKKIKINFIGELDKIPLKTLKILKNMQVLSKNNVQLNLNVILNYNPYDELKYVFKRLINKKNNNDITKKDFQEFLYLGKIPEPDILIRTGGYKRLSNFLLLYLGYTEFFFTKTLWPDLEKNEIDKIINLLKKTKRNYVL